MPLHTSQINTINDYPTIRPSLNLDFAKSASLDSRITFSRTSKATATGKNGLVKDYGENEPRFDYDETTGECLGLFVEEARTNLYRNSDISLGYNSTWSYGSWASGTYTASTGTQYLPDGTNGNCLQVTKNANGGSGHFHQGTTPGWAADKRYCISVWVKGSGAGSVRFSAHSGFSVLSTSESGDSTTCSVTDDWRRIYVEYGTDTYSSGYPYFDLNVQNNNSTIYFWGFQAEEIPGGNSVANHYFPSSFIRTASSSATRPYDSVTLHQKEMDKFFNWDEGTIIAEHDRAKTGTTANAAVAINNGSITYFNMIVLNEAYNSSGLIGRVYVSSSSTYAGNISVTTNFGVFNTYAFGYKTNDCGSAANGTSHTDNSVTLPAKSSLTTFKIMRGYADTPINGRMKYLRYYPKKLSTNTIKLLSVN